MDNPLMPSSPAVVYANHYNFAPGELVRNGPVGSCMMLWCRSGHGEVETGDWRGVLPPGWAILLPWRHHITYRAERRDPFLVSAIHVIPGFADDRTPVGLQVPHKGQTVAGQDEGEHPLGRRSWLIELGRHPALAHCAEYALLLYKRGDGSGHDLRTSAGQLLREWAVALASTAALEPDPLARAREFLQHHLGRRVSRDQLAEAAGVSPATLQRLTAGHLRMSPAAWGLQVRIDAAAELLARSRLSLDQVAGRFGFCDAFHFSRAFRRRMGVAPGQWRRRHPLL
jgi:AraC-like DNA-binding protein